MKNYYGIKSGFLISIIALSTFYFGYAPIIADDFEIIPKANENVSKDVEEIKVGGSVRDIYNEKAKIYEKENKIGEAMASGIFSRDLLLSYVVYLTRFLSQIGLFIGSLMIIYAGYIYASSVFTGKTADNGKKAITNAIIGTLVIIFSYAIMKILTSAFIT